MLWGEDPGGVVDLASVVQNAILRDGYMITIPDVGEVEGGYDDPDEENNANTSIGMRMPGTDQGTAEKSVDLCPVESEASEGKSEADTGRLTEKLVDDDVIGSDPGDPGKSAERRDDEVREPRPNEHAPHTIHEPSVTGYRPAIGLGRVTLPVIVKSIQETNVDQSARPDHSCGLNKELPDRTCKSETETLCRKGKEDVKTPAKRTCVEIVEFAQ